MDDTHLMQLNQKIDHFGDELTFCALTPVNPISLRFVPLYIAGEHASWIMGWIADAFESALHTVKNLHQLALA